MIFYGTRLFGLAHLVPGRFYVATKFFHLFFIPLIPIETWIVTKEGSDSWEGKPTKLSARSVTLAWLRAAAVVIYLGIAAKLAYDLFYARTPIALTTAIVLFVVSVLCLVAYRLTYRLSVATNEEARHYAVELGYSPAEAERIEVPPGTRILGRPGLGLAISLIPLLVWSVGAFWAGRVMTSSDPYTVIFESIRASDSADAWSSIYDFTAENAEAVPRFREYLRDENGDVRYAAAYSLGQVGEAARAALPELKAGLRDTEWQVRTHCAYTLAKLGEGYEDAIDDLITMLTAKGLNVVGEKCAAARALAALGPKAQAAIPTLKSLLEDSEADVRDSAAQAIAKIEGGAA